MQHHKYGNVHWQKFATDDYLLCWHISQQNDSRQFCCLHHMLSGGYDSRKQFIYLHLEVNICVGQCAHMWVHHAAFTVINKFTSWKKIFPKHSFLLSDLKDWKHKENNFFLLHWIKCYFIQISHHYQLLLFLLWTFISAVPHVIEFPQPS